MYLRLVLIFALVQFSTPTTISDWKYNLYRGLQHYVRTGEESDQLRLTAREIAFPQLFRKSYVRKQRDMMESIVCPACDIGLGIVITARRAGASVETLGDIIEFICKSIIIESAEVCKGVVELNRDILGYIIDNKPDLTSERVCSILLQNFNCKDSNRTDWTIKIPPRLRNNAPQVQDPKPGKSYKILQLTDMHYDPDYKIGSNAVCVEPLCCQVHSPGLRSEDKAGYWGDYRGCDLPWHSVVDVLDHVVDQHGDVDLIYFTGDIINHKVWKTNIKENTEAISKVFKQLKETFGNLKIYPILGNHEPHPVNMFSSKFVDNNHSLSTRWIFELVAEEWSRWLPKETKQTILKGGYYTVLHRPGFRIIALNSNVCYTMNFWLFHDDEDPFGQLQWLADTLAKAEKLGERVHILSHVATGDATCLHNWAEEYTKIIYRFSHIISAQFNGHTHNDDTVILFTQDKKPEPVNIAFNGGSLTPYSDLNPNYKVYEVDSNTQNVLDFDTWSYNLTEANADPQISPQWKKLYSFKESFGLSSVTPNDVAKLVERMTKDPKLTESYFRFQSREADSSLALGCDSDCEIENICYMVTFVHGKNFQCQTFTDMYNSNRPKPKPT
ncbi:hypothetical protein PPYR_07199 [Photinus pyralis]|uniref:Sphingomyelin phosphodiesterase n=3 Tax=Photinus pyralis TaxID=7054 RepID=A0A5N4APR5_PHOPY|nr:sphingomyelin phosphodiesterase-like [Photinus pyralis]KAB0799319.1 hypothetical protein PPYR_07199 [Photinus pyralis]